jgi:hypothetical protein
MQAGMEARNACLLDQDVNKRVFNRKKLHGWAL